MPNMKLNIKWGKETVEVDADESLSVVEFKSLVYSMTNVGGHLLDVLFRNTITE